MLPGAHVADRTGLLAVAGQPCGGQGVERHPLAAAGQERLADAGPAEHPLERADVQVLARMRARQDRDLGRPESKASTPRLDERDRPERLDRRAQRDDAIGIAEDADRARRRHRLRRCRRGGRSPRCRCASAGRAPASSPSDGRRCGTWDDAVAEPRVRSRVGHSPWWDRAGRKARIPRRRSLRVSTMGVIVCHVRTSAARRRLQFRRRNRPRRSPCPPRPSTPRHLHVSRHPAVLHKLAILRDERTEPKKFREVVRELSWLLGYEALADVAVKPIEDPSRRSSR